MEALPFIDEHTRLIGATPTHTWDSVKQLVRRHLARPAPALFVALWRLEPSSGFAITEETAPSSLTLRGKHRFSRYELAFVVDTSLDGKVTLRARTSAKFIGVLGLLYRALVIGSGGHRIVVRRMLAQVAESAEGQKNKQL